MGRFPSYKRPIEYVNGNAYLVHAVYPIVSVRNPSLIKEWLGVDTTFKVNRDGTYWFCEEIQEIDWENV